MLAQFPEKVGHQGKGHMKYGQMDMDPRDNPRSSILYLLRRATQQQRTADLPPELMEPSPPLTYCGMGCLGIFLWNKKGRSGNDVGLPSPVLLKGNPYWHAEWSVWKFPHKWSTLSFISMNSPIQVMLAEYGKDEKSEEFSAPHFLHLQACFSKKLPLTMQ